LTHQIKYLLGAVHKRRLQSGGRGVCPMRTSFRTRGFFRCGRQHFLAQNNFGFFEIYGVSARTRGVKPVRTKVNGWGQFFAILCGIFYGRPLTVVANHNYLNWYSFQSCLAMNLDLVS